MLKCKRYRIISVLSLIFLVAMSVNAQRWKTLRYQVGGGVGATQIFGDIGGGADKNNWFGLKDISIQETSVAAGVYARYKVNSLVTAKVNLYYGSGKGNDVDSRNDRGRSYKATFYEFSGQVEYYFLPEEATGRSAAMFDRKGMINNYSTISSYVFVGLGVDYSKLEHNYGLGIQPGDEYKSTNLAPIVPFGIGARYIIDQRWSVDAEFGYRWALNDFVEGYTTKYSKYNDIYYFFMASVNYRLKTTRKGLPAFLDRKNSRYGF